MNKKGCSPVMRQVGAYGTARAVCTTTDCAYRESLLHGRAWQTVTVLVVRAESKMLETFGTPQQLILHSALRAQCQACCVCRAGEQDATVQL
jgi:hypothetical protein